MAEALPSSFEGWIRSLLNDLQSNNDDMSDFVQYLLGIVSSDSESDDEKLTAIGELLTDLDLKVNFSSKHANRQTYQFHLISTITMSANLANKYSIDGINHKTI